MGHSPLVGHRRFFRGSQSSLTNWLLSSKKSYFSYIYWETRQKSGTPMRWPLFRRSRQKPLSQKWRPFFILEIRAKIALPEVKTFFWRSGKSLGIQRWLESGDIFFRGGGLQSYSRTAVIHRAMGHANFQTTQNEPRFRKGWEPLVRQTQSIWFIRTNEWTSWNFAFQAKLERRIKSDCSGQHIRLSRARRVG